MYFRLSKVELDSILELLEARIELYLEYGRDYDESRKELESIRRSLEEQLEEID